MSVANSAGYHGFPLPVGSVIAYANNAVPPTFLKCDGNAFSSIDFPELYKVLGTTYNTGGELPDEFRTPDLTTNARFVQGTDSTSKSGVKTPASIVVANTTFTLLASNIPSLVPANFGQPAFNITSTADGNPVNNKVTNNFDGGVVGQSNVKTDGNNYGTGTLTMTGATIVAGSAAPTPVAVTFGGVGTTVSPESYEMIYIIKAISGFENSYAVPQAPPPPSFTVFNTEPALSGFINPSPILT
jgi:microcystin-dependent protein